MNIESMEHLIYHVWLVPVNKGVLRALWNTLSEFRNIRSQLVRPLTGPKPTSPPLFGFSLIIMIKFILCGRFFLDTHSM